MEHLHEGLFAGPVLRWLYFLSGLMGAAMVATGALMWTGKRRRELSKDNKNDRALYIVERLNIGVTSGLPIAIAAYFWSNRLLPSQMLNRPDWEAHSLFIVWLIALLQPFLVHARSTSASWELQLKIASVAYLLIPVLNFISSDNHLLNSLPNGDWVLAGFDISMLLFATGFALAGYIISPKGERQSVMNPQGSTAS